MYAYMYMYRAECMHSRYMYLMRMKHQNTPKRKHVNTILSIAYCPRQVFVQSKLILEFKFP